jgi:hypothetical protein
VIGAAGTRHFEPDGVVFCGLACLDRDRNEIEKRHGSHETTSRGHEASRKQALDTLDPDQQWGSIMWSLIINLVYARSCEKYLANLVRHRHAWT